MDREAENLTGEGVASAPPPADAGPAEHAEPARPPRRRITRRQAIKYGVAGLAGLAGAGALGWRLLGSAAAEVANTAEIFKGDAPKGELWRLWRKRDWVREARHYVKLGRNVQCKLCPNNCLLEPDDRSHCRNRVNKDGTLYTLVYGNPCAFNADPIEKKPLFHFLPATGAFSISTSGCVLRCLNCQNWDISQKKPEETKNAAGQELRLTPYRLRRLRELDARRFSMFPDDVVALAKHFACRSIAYTYGEPIAFYEYTLDTCRQAHQAGVKNVVVTSGYINERPLRQLGEHLDAIRVDLKGFDDAVYRKLNSGALRPVLDTLKTARDMGLWLEIICLIVPTYTDKLDVIERMCGWLADNLGPDCPVHFSRFHPQHKLTHLPPTPVGVLNKARELARSAGLRYVYIGNVPGLREAQTTYCPGCKRAVVERNVYAVKGLHIRDGRCEFCGTEIAGVW